MIIFAVIGPNNVLKTEAIYRISGIKSNILFASEICSLDIKGLP